MTERQRIAECNERPAKSFSRVGFRYSMVKMDLDLSPPSMAVLG
jgi:hypothetical protein